MLFVGPSWRPSMLADVSWALCTVHGAGEVSEMRAARRMSVTCAKWVPAEHWMGIIGDISEGDMRDRYHHAHWSVRAHSWVLVQARSLKSTPLAAAVAAAAAAVTSFLRLHYQRHQRLKPLNRTSVHVALAWRHNDVNSAHQMSADAEHAAWT